MESTLKIDNTINIFSVDADVYDDYIFKKLYKEYGSIRKFANQIGSFKNLVMDVHKLDYNLNLWNSAVKLWITNVNTDPVGNEITPDSGTILYKATSAHEQIRTQGNPYVISYSIADVDEDGRSGNGLWGSLCWLKADDTLINRVKTNIYKETNKVIFIELNARIL